MPSFLSKVFGGRKKDKSEEDRQRSPSLLGDFETVDATTSNPSSPASSAFPTSKLSIGAPHLSLKLSPSSTTPLDVVYEQYSGVDVSKRRLTVEESTALVKVCAAAIMARGLNTPGIFHPHWYSASPAVQQKLISLFIHTLLNNNDDSFESEIDGTNPHDVAAVLRWGLRHLSAPQPSFGLTPDWYPKFLLIERTESYPTKAFSIHLAPLLPKANLVLLERTLELFESLAAHAESNSTSGSKLSMFLGGWLLGVISSDQQDKDFMTFYEKWERAGRMLEHLFLARIRDQASNQRIPTRLAELVRNYPYLPKGTTTASPSDAFIRPRFTTRKNDAIFVRIETETSSSNDTANIKEKMKDSMQMVEAAVKASAAGVEKETLASVWQKIQATLLSSPTLALSDVFADETIRFLSLRGTDDVLRSPTFSVSADKPNNLGGRPKLQPISTTASSNSSPRFATRRRSFSLSDKETSNSVATAAASKVNGPAAGNGHAKSTSISSSPTSNNIGLDWGTFSTSGFLSETYDGSIAGTLLDKKDEVKAESASTSRPSFIVNHSTSTLTIARKESTKSGSKKSRHENRKSVDGALTSSTLTSNQVVELPKLTTSTNKVDLIQIDEAFVDFWSDVLEDSIELRKGWPTFVVCRLKGDFISALDADGTAGLTKKVEYLIIEHVVSTRTPTPPVSAVESKPLTDTRPSSPTASSLGTKKRNLFSRWTSSATIGGKADKKEKSEKIKAKTMSSKGTEGVKVGEMGEIVTDDSAEKSKAAAATATAVAAAAAAAFVASQESMKAHTTEQAQLEAASAIPLPIDEPSAVPLPEDEPVVAPVSEVVSAPVVPSTERDITSPAESAFVALPEAVPVAEEKIHEEELQVEIEHDVTSPMVPEIVSKPIQEKPVIDNAAVVAEKAIEPAVESEPISVVAEPTVEPQVEDIVADVPKQVLLAEPVTEESVPKDDVSVDVVEEIAQPEPIIELAPIPLVDATPTFPVQPDRIEPIKGSPESHDEPVVDEALSQGEKVVLAGETPGPQLALDEAQLASEPVVEDVIPAAEENEEVLEVSEPVVRSSAPSPEPLVETAVVEQVPEQVETEAEAAIVEEPVAEIKEEVTTSDIPVNEAEDIVEETIPEPSVQETPLEIPSVQQDLSVPPGLEPIIAEEPVVVEDPEVPIVDEPTVEEPVAQEPVVPEEQASVPPPINDAASVFETEQLEVPLVAVEPIVQEEQLDVPAVEEESVQKPIQEEVVSIPEPVAEKEKLEIPPVQDEIPSVGQEEPVVEEEQLEIPDSEPIMAEEPVVAEDPVVEEPIVDEPTVEEPIVEEPVVPEEQVSVPPPINDAASVLETEQLEVPLVAVEPIVQEEQLDVPAVEEESIQKPIQEEVVSIPEPVAEEEKLEIAPVQDEIPSVGQEEPVVEEEQLEIPPIQEPAQEESPVEQEQLEIPPVQDESSIEELVVEAVVPEEELEILVQDEIEQPVVQEGEAIVVPVVEEKAIEEESAPEPVQELEKEAEPTTEEEHLEIPPVQDEIEAPVQKESVVEPVVPEEQLQIPPVQNETSIQPSVEESIVSEEQLEIPPVHEEVAPPVQEEPTVEPVTALEERTAEEPLVESLAEPEPAVEEIPSVDDISAEPTVEEPSVQAEVPITQALENPSPVEEVAPVSEEPDLQELSASVIEEKEVPASQAPPSAEDEEASPALPTGNGHSAESIIERGVTEVFGSHYVDNKVAPVAEPTEETEPAAAVAEGDDSLNEAAVLETAAAEVFGQHFQNAKEAETPDIAPAEDTTPAEDPQPTSTP